MPFSPGCCDARLMMVCLVHDGPAKPRRNSEIAQRSDVAQQFLMDAPQEGPGVLIVLLSTSSSHVLRELVKVLKDGSTNLIV